MKDGTFASRRAVGLLLGVAGAYVVVALLEREIGATVPVPLTPGLVVAVGLLLGPITAWGAATGHVASELLAGTFGPTTAVGYLAQFVLVVTACRLWGTFELLPGGVAPGVPTLRNLGEYALVGGTAAVVAAASVGFGSAFLGASPFAAVVVDSLLGAILSVLVVGAPVLYALAPIVDRTGSRINGPYGAGLASIGTRSVPAGPLLAAVGTATCLAGYGTSVVFHDVGLTSDHLLINRLGRGILPILTVAGPDGSYLQAMLALLFVVAYAALLRPLSDAD